MTTESVLFMRDIPSKYESPGLPFRSEADVDEHVDLPLRAACKIFLKKKIYTYWSSANGTDDIALLFIDPELVSPANIQIAKEILDFKDENLERIRIRYPISSTTPPKEVEAYFVSIADQFEDQSEA